MRIRALEPDDVPGVARLHRTVFSGGGAVDSRGLEAFLRRILCEHPWPDPELPSLVCEDDTGEVVGCLGVMPRPMRFAGEPLRAVVFHEFMMAPERRGSLAAVELAKRGLAGPQELSLADGNDASRRILELFGGHVVTVDSLRWVRPLRPLGSALRLFVDDGSASRGFLGGLGGLADRIAGHLPGLSLRPSRDGTDGVELTAQRILDGLPEVTRDLSLVPVYDEPSLRWLLETLESSERSGPLRRVLVREGGRVLGWYVYCARPGGVGEVVQIGARPETARRVVCHLFADAWERDLVAVSGQLAPALVEPLSGQRCFFDHAGFWMLARSERDDVLAALHRGDAFLGRLEGEGWLRLAF